MEAVNQLSTTLQSGQAIPLLGFGTWRLEGRACYEAVRSALDAGYRHIDTATGYSNEEQVGRAIHDSGIDRNEVFLTTKCPPEHAGRERETLDQSLRALGTEYVDLWLVHWPPGGQARPGTWRQFISEREGGRARSIGVSNYSIAQIDELVDATGEAPAINQIPWSPFIYDPATASELAKRQVLLEGYSPLRRSDLAHPVLVGLAASRSRTVAQVVLRWHLQHGFVAIPKSARRERIEENRDLGFELSDEEMARLDSLGRP